MSLSHQYTGIGYRTFKRLNTGLVNLRTVDNDNDNDNDHLIARSSKEGLGG